MTTTTVTYPQEIAGQARDGVPFVLEPTDRRRNRGFGTLFRTELKIWLRHPATIFFALLMPTAFIVLNGVMSPEFATHAIDDPTHLFYGLTTLQIFLPGFLMMAAITPFLAFIPAEFGGLREKGVLKRFSGSPMKPSALIAVHYLINLGAALFGAILALVISGLMWGISVPQNLGTVVLGWVLGTAAMAAVGTLIAARVQKASVGNGVGTALMFLMLILSGVMGGGFARNAVFRNIARFSPAGAATQIMEYGWHGVGSYGFPLFEVLALLAWIVIPAVIGLKLFRWR